MLNNDITLAIVGYDINILVSSLYYLYKKYGNYVDFPVPVPDYNINMLELIDFKLFILSYI